MIRIQDFLTKEMEKYFVVNKFPITHRQAQKKILLKNST